MNELIFYESIIIVQILDEFYYELYYMNYYELWIIKWSDPLYIKKRAWGNMARGVDVPCHGYQDRLVEAGTYIHILLI